MLPFQGAYWNVLLFPQGVAIGLGYKWFSTICKMQADNSLWAKIFEYYKNNVEVKKQ